jgi:DNA-binding CsgD family transcriptional regulator
VTALAGRSRGHAASCRAALTHLGGHLDRFVTLSTALIGPVGWFASEAHAALGEHEAGLHANQRALELSRRFASVTWTARCLVQRAELLATTDPDQSRHLAREALSLAEGRRLAGVTQQAGKVAGALESPACPLDARQLTLLRLAASGLRNDQIARQLYVSTATVERHLSKIYRKLGVSNRAAAAHWLSLQDLPETPDGPE